MSRIENIQRKIISRQELDRWLAIARFKNRKIVFTNGCFDILHKGHVNYLAEASALGDLLVVGLNTDDSVKRLKGDSKPLLDETARALILASLSQVSAVVLFDEDTPYELIRKVQPDVLVKGGDYVPEDIVGYDLVTARGGKVLTINLTEGYSSSSLIAKMSGNS